MTTGWRPPAYRHLHPRHRHVVGVPVRACAAVRQRTAYMGPELGPNPGSSASAKARRSPLSPLMRRPASGPPTIRDWLGVNGDWPRPDGDGTVEDDLLSHTRMIPDDIISLGNELNEEILRQKQDWPRGPAGDGPPRGGSNLRQAVRRLGDRPMRQLDIFGPDAEERCPAKLLRTITSTEAYIAVYRRTFAPSSGRSAPTDSHV